MSLSFPFSFENRFRSFNTFVYLSRALFLFEMGQKGPWYFQHSLKLLFMSISIPIVYLFMRDAPRYIYIFFRKSFHLIFIWLSTTELLKSLQSHIIYKSKSFLFIWDPFIFFVLLFQGSLYGTFFSLSRPTWQKTRLFIYLFFFKKVYLSIDLCV